MKDSSISRNSIKWWEKLLAVLGWLLIWYIASRLINQEMLLASPVSVANRLWELIYTQPFWHAVGFSLSRVGIGFLLAFTMGILLAVVAWKVRVVAVFLRPFMGVTKAAPVASYIILCLLFLPSKNLSVCISFLMALPVMYTNVLEGLWQMDRKLLEMAAVFRVPTLRRVLYIYFSQLMPFLVAACSLSLGLCWKSGIAAEVIGLPLGSIGEHLYQAKIFVDTKTLFAWTVVVIALSFLFEYVFLALLKRLATFIERM